MISVITAHFFENYEKLKNKDVNTEGKLELMSLDQGEGQQEEQKKR